MSTPNRRKLFRLFTSLVADEQCTADEVDTGRVVGTTATSGDKLQRLRENFSLTHFHPSVR